MPSERGNVLFLILIAVALFAALSFAATQTLRSTPQDPQGDTQKLGAATLIQHTTFIAQAVQTMAMRRITGESFCFDSPLWGHNNYYHAACDNADNRVFSTSGSGGGASVVPVPDGINDGSPWYITGQSCIIEAAQNCNTNGNQDEDIILFVPHIYREVCIALNDKLGVPNPQGNPPKASGNLWPPAQPVFTGNFLDGGRVDSGGNGNLNILAGHTVGCVEGGGTPPAGTYAYFHVLLRR